MIVLMKIQVAENYTETDTPEATPDKVNTVETAFVCAVGPREVANGMEQSGAIVTSLSSA